MINRTPNTYYTSNNYREHDQRTQSTLNNRRQLTLKLGYERTTKNVQTEEKNRAIRRLKAIRSSVKQSNLRVDSYSVKKKELFQTIGSNCYFFCRSSAIFYTYIGNIRECSSREGQTNQQPVEF